MFLESNFPFCYHLNSASDFFGLMSLSLPAILSLIHLVYHWHINLSTKLLIVSSCSEKKDSKLVMHVSKIHSLAGRTHHSLTNIYSQTSILIETITSNQVILPHVPPFLVLASFMWAPLFEILYHFLCLSRSHPSLKFHPFHECLFSPHNIPGYSHLSLYEFMPISTNFI